MDAGAPGLLVRPAVARKQLDAEVVTPAVGRASTEPAGDGDDETEHGQDTGTAGTSTSTLPLTTLRPKRFHGTVSLDATRVGRDASRIADEVIAHLAGLVGARVTVTIEIEAEIPAGAPDHVVRTVTENSRTLRFSSQGFERE